MRELLKILLKELKIFAKSNWWIFIVFILCLILIYYTNSWNIIEVSIVFFLHFLGDLSVMIMVYYFSIKNNKYWAWFQIIQFFIFTILWLYAWFSAWKWHYLLPQIVFILPAIKSYFLEFKWKNISLLNAKTSIFLNIFIIFINYYLGLLSSINNIIQIFWFFFFSFALILIWEKEKYIYSLIWIFLITLGSFLSVYKSFLVSDIKWIDISYFLLPLTILVFYIKNFKQFIK
jgi:hypothetical protein